MCFGILHVAATTDGPHSITLLQWTMDTNKKGSRSATHFTVWRMGVLYFPEDRLALLQCGLPWCGNNWPQQRKFQRINGRAKFDFVFGWHLCRRWTVARINESKGIYYGIDCRFPGRSHRKGKLSLWEESIASFSRAIFGSTHALLSLEGNELCFRVIHSPIRWRAVYGRLWGACFGRPIGNGFSCIYRKHTWRISPQIRFERKWSMQCHFEIDFLKAKFGDFLRQILGSARRRCLTLIVPLMVNS